MGGSFDISSTPGNGSCFSFTVRLPSASPAVGGIATENLRLATAAKPAGAVRLDGVRILVAEDNAFNQQVAQELLESVGAVVEVVDNGQAVLDRISAGTEIDVVLMDVQMPVMDGLEATRRIRTTVSGDVLPIVAMTANAQSEDAAACRAAGMDDFVPKPIDPARLFATVAQYATAVGAGRPFTDEDLEVDRSALTRLLNDDQDKVRHFSAMWVDTTRKSLEQMDTALADGDLASVGRLAHSLKSSAATVGAVGFSNGCALLETSCRNGDEGGAHLQAAVLMQQFPLVRDRLLALEAVR